MRKKSFVKKIESFLRPVYFGLGIFAVTGLAFYVFAAGITFPGVQPNPVTGVVGMFAGVTDVKFTAASNYGAVNQLCAVQYPGSHVCTAMEIINSYNNGNTVVQNAMGRAWFNNGPPGHNQTLSNDCGGWQIKDAASFGSMWYFQNTSPQPSHRALINPCNSNDYAFACCL